MTGNRILIGLMLVAVLGLAACGRKTGLDTPYEAGMRAREEAQKAGQPLPPEPKKPVVDRPFILDPLL